MYQKVSTDLKFVDREKEVEKFWEENQIFEKSMENRKKGRHTPFTTALRPLMESRILVMFLPVLSKI